MQTTKEYRNFMLLTCADRRGYISIRKATRKLPWSKQKVIAVGNSLVSKGMLEKRYYADMLFGFDLKNF